jgi:hypothetical protein
MKSISRIAAVAVLATGAFLGNTHATSAPKTIAMKSAVPVPTCPWNSPDGCGIGNF